MTSIQNLINTVKSCADAVVEELGSGYKEGVYEEALSHEFRLCEVPYERQKNYEVLYKRHCIGTGRIDLVVGDALIVECKAVKNLTSRHRDQLRAYFETTELDSGILLNFPRYGGNAEIEDIDYPSERELKKEEQADEALPEGLRGVKSSADEVAGVLGTEFAYRGDKGIYKNALRLEFRERGIPYTSIKSELLYKNQVLGTFTGFLVYDQYLINLEFGEEITEEKIDDVKADMKLHELDEGLIINFPPEAMGADTELVKL